MKPAGREQTSGVTTSVSIHAAANGSSAMPTLLKRTSSHVYSQAVSAHSDQKTSDENGVADPVPQPMAVPAVSYTPFDQASQGTVIPIAPTVVRYGAWGVPVFRPNVYIEAFRNVHQAALAKAGNVVAVAKQTHSKLDAWIKSAPEKAPPIAIASTRELMAAYEKIWSDPLSLLLQPKVIKAEAARVAVRACVKSVCVYNHAELCEQTCFECSKLSQLRSLVSTLINDNMAQVQMPIQTIDAINKDNPAVGILFSSVPCMWQEYCQAYPQYGIHFSVLFDDMM